MCILTKRRLKRRVAELEEALLEATAKLSEANERVGVLERIGGKKESMIFDLQAEVARLKTENGDYEADVSALTTQVAVLNAELSKTPARGKDGRYRKRAEF